MLLLLLVFMALGFCDGDVNGDVCDDGDGDGCGDGGVSVVAMSTVTTGNQLGAVRVFDV